MALVRQFPTVLILGPRQVGKTTPARAAVPGATYLYLEQPGLRQLFADDPLFQIESRLPGKPGSLIFHAQPVRRGRFWISGDSAWAGSGMESRVREVSRNDRNPLAVALDRQGVAAALLRRRVRDIGPRTHRAIACPSSHATNIVGVEVIGCRPPVSVGTRPPVPRPTPQPCSPKSRRDAHLPPCG